MPVRPVAVAAEVPEVVLVQDLELVKVSCAPCSPPTMNPGVSLFTRELVIDLVQVLDRAAVVVVVMGAEMSSERP